MAQSVDERLAVLERELSEVKESLSKITRSASSESTPWWKSLSGIFANEPLFEDVVRFTEDRRDAERREAQAGSMSAEM
jgi:hypothetical protein